MKLSAFKIGIEKWTNDFSYFAKPFKGELDTFLKSAGAKKTLSKRRTERTKRIELKKNWIYDLPQISEH